MTGERCMLQCLTLMHGRTITFRGNQKGKIAGVGKISIDPYPPIHNVPFVKGLKHNMLNISQLCDNGLDVYFFKEGCVVQHKNGTELFTTKRKGNLYKINLSELSNQNITCLLSIKWDHWVWHKKLWHASLRLISKLQRHDLVRILPRMSYKDDLLCKVCQKEKHIKTSFSSKNFIFTLRTLELLHINLFGPTRTTSISVKKYDLAVVGDYSR